MNDINLLFAIEAAKLVQSGDYARAIGLCKDGIVLYPGYAAAWIILANAYEKDNQIELALKIVDEAQKNFPSHRGLNNFQDKMMISNLTDSNLVGDGIEFISQDELKLTDSFLEIEPEEKSGNIVSNSGKNFNAPAGFLMKFKIGNEEYKKIDADAVLPSIEDYKKVKTQELSKERKSYNPSVYTPELQNLKADGVGMGTRGNWIEDEIPNMSLENNLIKLAKKLEEVSLSQTHPAEITKISTESSSHGIITETMANIYIAQGAYEEALAAYNHLLLLNPEKENYYKEKIKDIRKRMN